MYFVMKKNCLKKGAADGETVSPAGIPTSLKLIPQRSERAQMMTVFKSYECDVLCAFSQGALFLLASRGRLNGLKKKCGSTFLSGVQSQFGVLLGEKSSYP